MDSTSLLPSFIKDEVLEEKSAAAPSSKKQAFSSFNSRISPLQPLNNCFEKLTPPTCKSRLHLGNEWLQGHAPAFNDPAIGGLSLRERPPVFRKPPGLYNDESLARAFDQGININDPDMDSVFQVRSARTISNTSCEYPARTASSETLSFYSYGASYESSFSVGSSSSTEIVSDPSTAGRDVVVEARKRANTVPLSEGNTSAGKKKRGGRRKRAKTNRALLQEQKRGETREDDKREVLFKTELCRAFEETGECKFTDRCLFAHGAAELRNVQRHPKYRTEICRVSRFYNLANLSHSGRKEHVNTEEDVALFTWKRQKLDFHQDTRCHHLLTWTSLAMLVVAVEEEQSLTVSVTNTLIHCC
jgi:hypothetical protein